MKKIQLLSGNTLKIIGAISMLIDHFGMIFFPSVGIFRIIGRLAFPIFAFLIAEGARYTRNKLKHLLSVLILGVLCQVVLSVYSSESYLNVLITFSMSIVACYALEFFKKELFTHTPSAKLYLSAIVFVGVIGAIFVLNQLKRAEYGFIGCMLPVLASILHMPSDAPESLKRLDRPWIHVLIMSIGALVLSITATNANQYFSLVAIPLLLLYSGKRGRLKMKYFFYIFYPAHLLILYGGFMLIALL